jgi:hypothetical protein
LRGQEGKSFRRAPYSTPNPAAKAAISGIFSHAHDPEKWAPIFGRDYAQAKSA